MPNFDFHKPFESYAAPEVAYVRDPEEADDYLSVIRSTRLSFYMGKDAKETYNRNGESFDSSAGPLSVLALADHIGVVVLHLSEMKEPPALLRPLLESRTITKQGCGAGSVGLELYKENRAHPAGFLDLRLLSRALFPTLFIEKTQILSNMEYLELMAEVLLEVRYATGGPESLSGRNLSGSRALDDITNKTWLTHLLGLVLHERLEIERQEQPVGDEFVEEVLAAATFDMRDFLVEERRVLGTRIK